MFHKQAKLFLVSSLAMLNPAQAVTACEPTWYSLTSKQLSFSHLAVEMYQPYSNIPDETYTLCVGQDGPIVMTYQSRGDFSFPYKRVSSLTEPPQKMMCNQKITKVENCYPTYSSKNGLLSFPHIRVPWRAILPSGNILEVGGSCYEAVLDQGAIRPEVFTLIYMAEKNCP